MRGVRFVVIVLRGSLETKERNCQRDDHITEHYSNFGNLTSPYQMKTGKRIIKFKINSGELCGRPQCFAKIGVPRKT